MNPYKYLRRKFEILECNNYYCQYHNFISNICSNKDFINTDKVCEKRDYQGEKEDAIIGNIAILITIVCVIVILVLI